jgi:hypothetical protein
LFQITAEDNNKTVNYCLFILYKAICNNFIERRCSKEGNWQGGMKLEGIHHKLGLKSPVSYQTSWSSGYHSCFVFGRSQVKLSALVTGYPDRGFLWFTSVHPGKYQVSTLKLNYNRFLQNPFQFIIIHLSPYHRRYTV